jgi:hypothetical protein
MASGPTEPRDPEERAERDIEELRRLFAGTGRRPTRRFGEIVAAAERQAARAAEAAAEDAGAAATKALPAPPRRSGPSPPRRSSPAPDGPPEPHAADRTGTRAEPDAAGAEAPEGAEAAETPHQGSREAPAPPAPVPAARPVAGERRPLPPPRRGRALLVATALVGAVGAFAAGLWLGQAQASPEPSSTAPVPQSVVTEPASVTTAASVVPPACLDTARFGDQVIDLLVGNRRGPELARALGRYADASRACRQAAKPAS